MQIKHTWVEEKKQGFISEKFIYHLTIRGALTKEELAAINKYKVMDAWLYSNRDEREAQKARPSAGANWWEHAAAG